MGNDPGRRLKEDENAIVHITLKGPFDKEDAVAFKKDLKKLLVRYKAKAKVVKLSIKKKPSA
jgi:hypothetical protein